MEYDPFIKSQLASKILTLGPYVVQIRSRSPQTREATEPAYSEPVYATVRLAVLKRRVHMETIMIYTLGSTKFTTKNDLCE